MARAVRAISSGIVPFLYYEVSIAVIIHHDQKLLGKEMAYFFRQLLAHILASFIAIYSNKRQENPSEEKVSIRSGMSIGHLLH